MRKTLFNASFEESQKLVENKKDLPDFVKKYFLEFRLRKILGISIITGIFIILPYASGVGIPQEILKANVGDIKFLNYTNVVKAAEIGTTMIIIPQIFVIIWIALTLYNVFRRLFPYTVITFIRSTLILGILFYLLLPVMWFPMLIGFALSGTGILGFSFQVLTIIFYFLREFKNKKQNILGNLFKLDNVVSKSKTSKVFKNSFCIIFLLLIFNMFFFQVGMITSARDGFALFYGWLLAIFGVGNSILILRVALPRFLSNFYFLKYSQEYRRRWQLTDEQWYGKRKARKIAKKKTKQEKKGDKKWGIGS